MNTQLKTHCLRGAAKLAVALGLLFAAGSAYSDPPVTMAPPMDSGSAQVAGSAAGNVSPNSVFNWSEVPQNQQVPVQRAVFDRGGYQLYDTVGETIVIPFTNQNLYVLKFAPSPNGTMYFINEGSAPVLYVPQNGYLENATVSGARWYPFSAKFHPSHPVFIGLAPSWNVFVGMGWYPGMYYHGGYWGNTSFLAGGLFIGSVGLFFEIGGHHYDGWGGYHDYAFAHPAPYREGYFNRNVYHWAGPAFRGDRSFGGDHAFAAQRSFGGSHAFGGEHSFGGGDHPAYAHRTFRGAGSFSSGHSYSGGYSHSSGHSFGGGRSYSGGHSHGGESGRSYGGEHRGR